MKKIDSNFENELLKKYKDEFIKPDAKDPYKKLIELDAQRSIKLFAMAYNKLVDEGYLKE
jgi:hypothetical protein